MKYIDPLTKREIQIKSIYIPAKTLLQGKEYKRTNDVIRQQTELQERQRGK